MLRARVVAVFCPEIPAQRTSGGEDAGSKQPQPSVEALETSMAHREPEPHANRARTATVAFVAALVIVLAIVLAYLLLK
jgi:hypothetical protein